MEFVYIWYTPPSNVCTINKKWWEMGQQTNRNNVNKMKKKNDRVNT